jgi:hypothetical protein
MQAQEHGGLDGGALELRQRQAAKHFREHREWRKRLRSHGWQHGTPDVPVGHLL